MLDILTKNTINVFLYEHTEGGKLSSTPNNALAMQRPVAISKSTMYLAAGTPVIACNIPGFQFVKEFNAGILIDDYEPLTIKNAIYKIESSYQEFQTGCYEAAKYYSFDKNTIPFVQFLLETSSSN